MVTLEQKSNLIGILSSKPLFIIIVTVIFLVILGMLYRRGHTIKQAVLESLGFTLVIAVLLVGSNLASIEFLEFNGSYYEYVKDCLSLSHFPKIYIVEITIVTLVCFITASLSTDTVVEKIKMTVILTVLMLLTLFIFYKVLYWVLIFVEGLVC